MKKEHWQDIYATKGMQEVSWFQKVPEISLDLIQKVAPNKDASIIDVGGGDGFLVDNLLELGYTNITVLDISENAINRAKQRLGNIDEKVKWVISDITNFLPEKKYDVWHDRAVFHFLTEQKDIAKYKTLVNKSINDYFVLATFSDEGPNKCSGLEICKYSELDLKKQFDNSFKVIESFKKNHSTPFNTTQNFTFSVFQKQY
ncbi:MAG: methyltransferase [Flavobacteriales bacterium]|jgi:SAM-dependent methyltransferase|nr:methyltransferase [Flavobacteriales bacterium]|tara:strand:- start:1072 stop:1677 length:606 start_codon:yes stop_codon:yes gene_type:complete